MSENNFKTIKVTKKIYAYMCFIYELYTYTINNKYSHLIHKNRLYNMKIG